MIVYIAVNIGFFALGYFTGGNSLPLGLTTTVFPITIEMFFELLTRMSDLSTNIAKISENSSAILSELRKVTETRPEIVMGPQVSTALVRARTMQLNATSAIYAMWTVFPYDEDLKKYFEETLRKGIYTRRLIDIETVPLDSIMDHVERYWDLIWKGLYEVYFVEKVYYEAIVVDHKEAAIFHYPGDVNLPFDFSHPPKLLRNRLMPFENAIFGVKNAILGITDLIKPCNHPDKPFIKNKPETRRFPEQRVWRGYRHLHPNPNPKFSNAKLSSRL